MAEPNPAGLQARERLLRARAAEARAQVEVAEYHGERDRAFSQRGLATGLHQAADQFASYATALRKNPPTETVHKIVATRIADGGRELILTDGDGRQFDIANVIFADGVRMRDVGSEPSFMARGLYVTFVLENEGEDEPLLNHTPPPTITGSSPAVQFSKEQLGPRPDTIWQLPDSPQFEPLEEPDPEVAERWVKHDGDTRTVIEVDEASIDEDDRVRVPYSVQRMLLMEAGYERVYVRDDIELDRARRKAAAGGTNSTPSDKITNVSAYTWDTVPLDMVKTFDPGHPAKTPRAATPRGRLVHDLWSELNLARRTEERTVDLLEESRDLQRQRGDIQHSVTELYSAIEVLDAAPGPGRHDG